MTAPWPGRTDGLCFVDSASRLYVIAGKQANPSGVAVSNDVWQGSYPSGSTPASLTWKQQTAAAPFPASDGIMGATYYSSVLQTDVLYVGGGYHYENLVAQFQGDNGVGFNEVYVSLNQGVSWTSIGHAAWGTRYHGKWLAAPNGVLAVLAGASEAPTTSGGASQISSVFLNDMWASVDGGFTWGQCSSAIFPAYPSSTPASQYVRGTGREDPLVAIDPATGLVYLGSGIQFNPTATGVAYPSDLFVSNVSFASPAAVAAACGGLPIPPNGFGLQVAPPFSLIPLTLSGPFLPRQQGGLYIVTPNTPTSSLSLSNASTSTVAPAVSSLILYGGTLPGQTGQAADVWYSANGTSYSQVSNGAFVSQSYGPTACVDIKRQIMYSIGGDTNGGDSAGTNAVWASTNLGQSWTQSAGLFPGRGNAVCVVDSQSRVFVAGGKQVNTNGVAVSNDVWMGVLTSTTPVTLTWTAQTLTAPFVPCDGPSAATYYSPALGLDVLYYQPGYSYLNVVAQYQGDSGVGNNDVWVSTTAGVSWYSLGHAAFPTRYHARMLATYQGVLVIAAGANDLPPTQGGASQVSSILRNDMWASLDGGYTWGQCGAQVYPLNNPAIAGSLYSRGTGREDPVFQIDNTTGFIYTGMGLQRNPTGGAVSPQDLFRTSISFYDVAAVAGLCGDLTVPTGGTGLQAVPPLSLVPLTLSGPFSARQQGGLYVVNVNTQNVETTVTVVGGASFQAVPSALVIYGGRIPGGNGGDVSDVWYTAPPQTTYQQVVQSTFPSEAYGPADCVDQYKQIIYSIGGTQAGGDTNGTSAVYASTNLGQTWTQSQGTFPGRGNAVCVVDSFSRVYVVGGKVANPSGVAVANDVWVGALTSTNPVTLTWTQASAAAPFAPRDGPSAASYYSAALGLDVLYYTTGYLYENLVAQNNDNGVGSNDVWMSTTQGQTWALLGYAAFPLRYHAKMLATNAGVLVILAGNNAPPTTNGGASQGTSYTRNDMWASLDGGYTWGQCSAALFPVFSPSTPIASYTRGTGREDPLFQIDYGTGYLYTGSGLQYAPNGTAIGPSRPVPHLHLLLRRRRRRRPLRRPPHPRGRHGPVVRAAPQPGGADHGRPLPAPPAGRAVRGQRADAQCGDDGVGGGRRLLPGRALRPPRLRRPHPRSAHRHARPLVQRQPDHLPAGGVRQLP